MFSTWMPSLTSVSGMQHFNTLQRQESIEGFANEFFQLWLTGLQVMWMDLFGISAVMRSLDLSPVQLLVHMQTQMKANRCHACLLPLGS